MNPHIWALGLIAGGLSLLSLLLYAFTGMPLWAPLQEGGEGFVRFALLFLIHSFGVMAGIAAFIEGRKEDQ